MGITDNELRKIIDDYQTCGYSMSRRDMFAMAALQGMLASTANMPDWPMPENITRAAVGYADALIAALDRPTEEGE